MQCCFTRGHHCVAVRWDSHPPRTSKVATAVLAVVQHESEENTGSGSGSRVVLLKRLIVTVVVVTGVLVGRGLGGVDRSTKT